MYLGGTVHILKEKDYPLPAEFDAAYNDSQILVLEVNPAEMSKAEMQQYVGEHGVYTDERTLKTVLSEKVYKEFRQYCKENNISVMGLNKFKPSLIMMTLLGRKVEALKPAPGVDMHFFEKSKADGKKVQGLETNIEQLDILVSMGDGQESEFLSQSIRDISTLDKELDEIISVWRNGDLKKSYELHVKDMETKTPQLYKSLLVDRNNKWIIEIEKFLNTPEIELVLVGDAHLAGPNGLIEMLRKKGYNVTQVKIPENKSNKNTNK